MVFIHHGFWLSQYIYWWRRSTDPKKFETLFDLFKGQEHTEIPDFPSVVEGLNK